MISELMSTVPTTATGGAVVVISLLFFFAVFMGLVVSSSVGFEFEYDEEGKAAKAVVSWAWVIAIVLGITGSCLIFTPVGKTDGVAFDDASAFVKEETGNKLHSTALIFSVWDTDARAERLKSESVSEWYIATSDGEEWDLKAHDNGQLAFRNSDTKKWASMDDLTVVEESQLKKQIEKESELVDVTVKFAGGKKLVNYQMRSPSEQLVLVTGEYDGQLVKAYAGLNEDDNSVRLVPVNKAGGVTEDDLVQK